MEVIEDKKSGNPYKGLYPYEEEDKNRFYGREADKKKLFRLVKYNFLTAVFGKSGIGKTSLLNAGVFPQLREKGFLPIRLRLNYSEEEPPLLEQIHQTIKKELVEREIKVKTRGKDESAKTLSPDETLWEYFHRATHFDNTNGKKITPVLVLDQFEEIFTVGKNNQNLEAWINELFYLIEDEFPEALRDRILKGEEEFPFSSERQDVRVIISLREDYLPHFTELKKRIASIDRVMFRVIHLNGKQAREIIGMPGGFTGEKIINKILQFFYPESVVEDEKVLDEKLEKKLEIEPVFLSLLCHQLYKKQTLKSITKEDQGKILGEFYDSVLKKFSDEVNEFIESKLLTEGGYRTPFYLEPNHSLKDPIDKLVNRRILRKYHDGKKEYIEIIHDVLTPVIKKKRTQRKQKRKNLLIAALSILLAIFIGLTWFAFDQKDRADRQYKNAQTNRLTAEALLEFPGNNTRAIRIAGAAFDIGRPNPPARTCKILTDIGYSSIEKPFYTTVLHHKESIYTAVFSPNEGLILTASEDGTAKLWDMEGNLKADLKEHTGRVFSAVFSPKGDRILTASWDKTAKLWEGNGSYITDLTHDGIVESAVFSGDGKWILTASRDGTARLWDHDGKFPRKLKHEGTVNSVVFSKDGNLILTASWDKSAKLWSTYDGNLLKTLEHKGAVNSAVFSPDSNRILTASSDRTAILWSLEGKKQKELKHNGAVNSGVFHPDGNHILTASTDSTAKLWNLEGNLLKNLNHNGAVTSVVFSEDGCKILTASEDGTAKVWDIKGNLLAELKKHKVKIRTAVFSQDTSRVLTASEDGTAMVWLLDNNIVTDLNKHNAGLSSAVFSLDGSLVLTASHDSTAKVWNLSGKIWADLEKHEDIVLSAAFSPDGSKIVTASDDGTAKVWDIKGNVQADLKHNRAVSSAVFSPDGSQILTATRDGTVKLWDIEGKVLGVIKHQRAAVYSAVFSPDGSRILTASRDGTAKVWYTPEGIYEWLETAKIPRLSIKDKKLLEIR